MPDETLHHDETEFEHEDLGAGGIFAFLAGLAIVGVLIHLVLFGMYKYLDHYERANQPPQNPLVKAANIDTREASSEDRNRFPQPRLEVNERTQLNEQRLREEQVLDSYGWVDQKAGIVHIPIDRAMALIVQQGLPKAPVSQQQDRAKSQPGATVQSQKSSLKSSQR
jgi:hypothetical protein